MSLGLPGRRQRTASMYAGRIARTARVSWPLLDRIDLRIVFPTLRSHELNEDIPSGDSTAQVAARVLAAREHELARCGKLNSRLSIQELSAHCRLDAAGEQLFWQSQARLGVSAVREGRWLCGHPGAIQIAQLEDRHCWFIEGRLTAYPGK